MKFINILKKYKQLFIGILIGSFITSIPVSAAIKEYILYESECTLINSDGTKYEDKDYPLLMYKGSNYAPVGKIAQFLGVPFTWEGKTKTATFEKPLALTNSVDISTSDISKIEEGGDNVKETKTPLQDFTAPEINSENNPNLITKLNDEKSDFDTITYKNYDSIKYNEYIYVKADDVLKPKNIKYRISGKNNSLKLYLDDKVIFETSDANSKNYIMYKTIVYINIDLISKYLED